MRRFRDWRHILAYLRSCCWTSERNFRSSEHGGIAESLKQDGTDDEMMRFAFLEHRNTSKQMIHLFDKR